MKNPITKRNNDITELIKELFLEQDLCYNKLCRESKTRESAYNIEGRSIKFFGMAGRNIIRSVKEINKKLKPLNYTLQIVSNTHVFRDISLKVLSL